MRSLCKWAGAVANDLGLGEFEIKAHAAAAGSTLTDEDAIASVSCVYGRKIANISFAETFFLADPEEQRHVLLHELLHVRFWDSHALMESTLPEVMGVPAYKAFFAGLTLVDEHAIDALAKALEPLFPLWLR